MKCVIPIFQMRHTETREVNDLLSVSQLVVAKKGLDMILSLHTYSWNPLHSLPVIPRSLNYMTNCYSETVTLPLILPLRSAQTSSLFLSPSPRPPSQDNQPGASSLAVPGQGGRGFEALSPGLLLS